MKDGMYGHTTPQRRLSYSQFTCLHAPCEPLVHVNVPDVVRFFDARIVVGIVGIALLTHKTKTKNKRSFPCRGCRGCRPRE